MRRSFLRQAAPLLISLAVIGSMSLFVRHLGRNAPLPMDRVFVETLPEVPDLEGWPRPMLDRLEAAYDGLLVSGRQTASLIEMARLYHSNGFSAQAHACYLSLENAQPGNPEWPYMVAQLRQDFEDQDLVVEELTRSLELDPGYALAYWKLGDAYLKQGRWDEAEATFLRALSIDPADAWAKLGLGKVAAARDQYEAAETLLLSALELDRSLGPAYGLLSDVYLELGDIDSARTFREAGEAGDWRDAPWDARLAALQPYCYDLFQLHRWAEAYAQEGDLDAAGILLERAAGFYPDDTHTMLALGEHYLRMGRSEDAMSYLLEASRRDPEGSFPFAAVSDLLAREGRGAEALEVARSAVAAEPNSSAVWRSYGELLESEGRLGEAEAAFRSAVEVDPGDAQSELSLAMLLLRWKPEEGLPAFQAYLDRYPEDARARLALGSYMLDQERYAEAAELLEAAWRLDPDASGVGESLSLALIRRGNEAASSGHYAEAAQRYERALEVKPDEVAAHANLGVVLGYLNEDDAAIAHFEQYLALDPQNVRIYLRLGRLLEEKGQQGQARRIYERGMAIAQGREQRAFEAALASLSTADESP